MQALFGERVAAALRVGKVRIAAVDNNIAFREDLLELGNGRVDRIAGGRAEPPLAVARQRTNPALTMTMTLRGDWSAAASSAYERQPTIRLPWPRPATNASTFAAVVGRKKALFW